jgi:hypothetical protein
MHLFGMARSRLGRWRSSSDLISSDRPIWMDDLWMLDLQRWGFERAHCMALAIAMHFVKSNVRWLCMSFPAGSAQHLDGITYVAESCLTIKSEFRAIWSQHPGIYEIYFRPNAKLNDCCVNRSIDDLVIRKVQWTLMVPKISLLDVCEWSGRIGSSEGCDHASLNDGFEPLHWSWARIRMLGFQVIFAER